MKPDFVTASNKTIVTTGRQARPIKPAPARLKAILLHFHQLLQGASGPSVFVRKSVIFPLFAFYFLLPAFPACAQAQSKPQRETFADEPIRIKFQGHFESRPQPDGTDILTCTGGIYAYQRWLKEDAFLEIRAENAVLFYSQQSMFKEAATEEMAFEPEPNQVLAIYLEGDVTLQVDRYGIAADTKITADRLYYDFVNKNAVILDAVLRMQLPDSDLPLYIRASRIRQWSQNHFTAEHVKLSNDEFYQPHVSLGAAKLDIAAVQNQADPAGKISQYHYDLENVTVNLENTPIFWWPRAAGATTATKPNIPIQSMHTSISSEYGVGVESQWDLPWLMGTHAPDGLDSTLRLDEFSRRGPAAGIDLDYTGEKYFGALRSYLLNDNGQDRLGKYPSRKDVPIDDDLRGRARWQHRHYLPYDWQCNLEISYLSDRNFLESWREREFDTEKEQETVIYFKQQKNNWAFDFLNKFHLNDFDYTITEVPTLGLHGAGQDIFGVLTYQHDGYVSRMQQQAGYREVAGFFGTEQSSILPQSIDQDDFAFAISRHELSLPLHVGSLNISPTVIGTYVHDESRFEEFAFDDPRYDGPHQQNNFVQGAAGLRLSTQLWHIDNNIKSRMWDIDRIRHIIIPQVSAFWVNSDLAEAQQHDVFNFALSQRWQTRRGPQGQKRNADLLRLNTSVTLVTNDVDDAVLPARFFFSSPEPQFDIPEIINPDLANLGLARREQINQNLSDHADADWTWSISDTTVFTGDVNYNIHNALISQTAAAMAVQRSPRTRYYFGHRFLHNGDPFVEQDLKNGIMTSFRHGHFLTAGASYQINRKYTIAMNQQYDIERAAAAYTRATIIRKCSHWYGAFSIGYDATRDGVSFMVSFWPEGFDRFVLGSRRFTRLAP